jgi:hypothetical protein
MCHAKDIMYIIILYVCPFITYLMLLSQKNRRFPVNCLEYALQKSLVLRLLTYLDCTQAIQEFRG